MRKQAENDSELVEVRGAVKFIRGRSEETGWCVLVIEREDEKDCQVKGTIQAVKEGDRITALGRWVKHPKYGIQLDCEVIYLTPPSNAEGIERYLSSGMVQGIGPTIAKVLVKAFGDKFFDVIDNHPELLREVHGIGPVRYGRIMAGWEEQKAVREIMVFLASNNVSTAKAVRIYKTYGKKAVPIVSENPYRLARDVPGIGFKSADQIAKDLGIDKLSSFRLSAGLAFTLEEAALTGGHTCLPSAKLIGDCAVLLELAPDPKKKDSDTVFDRKAVEDAKSRIADCLTAEIESGNLILSDAPEANSVFHPMFFYPERSIARQLSYMAQKSPPWKAFDSDKEISEAEARLHLSLSPSQREAVRTALASRVMVITGGPGVGKTTIVRVIIEVLDKQGVSMTLCAPTGRAAKRLSESSGMEASTIHRLLGFGPNGFTVNSENPLEEDLIVADECSMMDVRLASSLLDAVDSHSAMIFVGDVDQLPSVGAGNFLRDVIESGCVPVIRLTEIYRQAASSWIVRVAHQINDGIYPEFPEQFKVGETDCLFIEREPDRIEDTIVALVSKHIPHLGYDPRRDVQVLSPMKSRTGGVLAMNSLLQEALNPQTSELPSVKRYGARLSVGDKVMQIENDYGRSVFNGDVGFVTGIDREEGNLTVDFGDVSAIYALNDLDGLVLSYACTIHKSQGSEYKVVVIPVTKAHSFMLKRNLIYTAVTRGKKLVLLVGEKGALFNAVKDFSTQPRITGLCRMLQRGGMVQSTAKGW